MSIEIIVPKLGWSMEECTFSGWLKRDGECVKVGEPLFTLETDKSAQDVESADAGILGIPPDAPKPGDTVKVGSRVGFLLAEGETLSSPATPAAPLPAPSAVPCESAAARPSPAPSEAPVGEAPASPRARRAARDLGVNLSSLQPTGAGGRIRERDVRKAAAGAVPAGAPPPQGGIPITSLRRMIAERMLNSREKTAPVTLTCRADATRLAALRRRFKSAAGESPAPSYTDILAKLAAAVLQRHPALAGRWDGERIVLPEAIHIGIAVDTEQGLIVPVIRDVLRLTLPELAQRARDLAEAARDRRIRPEDLQGGVFTLTNLGGYGIEAFTPIINYPESAILGLGVIRREPVVLADGSIASREQMTLSLTFDHRVVDGAPAARFLQSLRQAIEDPVIAP